MEYLPITVIKYLVANLFVFVEIEIIVYPYCISYFSKVKFVFLLKFVFFRIYHYLVKGADAT